MPAQTCAHPDCAALGWVPVPGPVETGELLCPRHASRLDGVVHAGPNLDPTD